MIAIRHFQKQKYSPPSSFSTKDACGPIYRMPWREGSGVQRVNGKPSELPIPITQHQ